jgi:hypothetical protein
MQYRLDNISAFLHAVETGSVSAAAQRMGLSKSVVSKHISEHSYRGLPHPDYPILKKFISIPLVMSFIKV